MILAATGHRPQRLFTRDPYSNANMETLIAVADNALQYLAPDGVNTGGALGWDQAVAIAAIRLNIPNYLYMPFHTYGHHWPKDSQNLLHRIAQKSADVIVVSDTTSTQALFARNQEMIEKADTVLALFDGSPTGGTAHAVRYAELNNKKVWNCYHHFTTLVSE